LESNGLLHELDRIHVICIQDADSDQVERYDPSPDTPPVEEGVRRLQEADAICGQNIIDFDIPAIQKVFPEFQPPKKVIDTLVMSRVIYPDIKQSDFGRWKKGVLPGKLIGSHGLEAWGYRLRVFKGDFGKTTDWATWTPEMSDYCEQDVRVTKKLHETLLTRLPKGECIDLEHQVQWIISRQIRHGVKFNERKAEKLYATLKSEWLKVDQQLQEMVPPFYFPGKQFTPKRDNRRRGYVAGCTMTKTDLVRFNPNSGHHIAFIFKKRYGWKPTKFTPKTGEPAIDEDVLEGLEYPEAKLLTKWLLLHKRLTMLGDGKTPWLKCVTAEGRIHGSVNICGTVSGRMSHFNPNLGQVPSSDHPYGTECRELFEPDDGHVLVGCDASSLEARNLGQFLAHWDGGAYGKAVVEGKKEEGTDFHTLNAKALGTTRPLAKRFFYAFIYGAGNEKLGAILGAPADKQSAVGKKAKLKFLKNLPALASLTEAITKRVKKRGYLIGLDGRILYVRSPHSALNLLLQSAGAVIMKKALVLCDEALQQEHGFVPGVDYEFVLNVHDEFQITARPEIAETIGETAAWSIGAAGEHFNFVIPQEGAYDIGNSWAETH